MELHSLTCLANNRNALSHCEIRAALLVEDFGLGLNLKRRNIILDRENRKLCICFHMISLP